jgi:hypothetical protein
MEEEVKNNKRAILDDGHVPDTNVPTKKQKVVRKPFNR